MALDILNKFLDFEKHFDGQVWIEFTRDHAEIPILSVAAYLFIVFYVPPTLVNREGFKVKRAFALWNLFLAVFSTIGAFRTIPHLLSAISQHGIKWTICTDPEEWYLRGPCGLWVGLFIYSKVPELLDTVFLVLQKKRVIFLAWFHHTTVLLYCWHAYHNRIGPGLWFASANYLVHSVMYTYYFLAAAGYHALARPFAIAITTIQILQMLLGSGVTVASAVWHQSEPCAVDPANYKLGLVMYVSYFWLFTLLFINKYFGAPRKAGKPPKAGDKQAMSSQGELQMCGVDMGTSDTAGFFHSSRSHSQDFLKSGTKKE